MSFAMNINSLSAQRAVIAVDNAKIYSLPWADGSPITTLMKSDTVRVLGKRGEWVKIAYGNGQKGWMQIQVRRDRTATNGQKENGYIGRSRRNGAANGTHNHATNTPDLIRKKPPLAGDEVYRRFGYSFGMGFMASDYTYSWRFVFHSTPRLGLEGSFKHVLGEAADSYFLMSNLSYLLKETGKTRPYLTVGMGVINTVPDRGIGTDGVSNMAINYGGGARKYINEKLSLMVTASQYTIFIGKGASHFREIHFGILIGKFWD